MTTLTAPPASSTLSAAPIETLADLMERLGGVPLNRIRFRPSPGTAVEQDVLDAEKQGAVVRTGGRRAGGENDGLQRIPPGRFPHRDSERLRPVAQSGPVTGRTRTFRLFPGLVRIPDVAFTSWDRMPDRRAPDAPMPHLAPDLAVEVLSESNTPGEMLRKRREYFTAGVRLVWLADPDPANR